MGNPNPKPPVQPDNLSERIAVQTEIRNTIEKIEKLQDKVTLKTRPDSPAAKVLKCNWKHKGETFYQRKQRVHGLLSATVSNEDIIEIISRLVERAKAGDAESIRILLDRLMGKPDSSVDVTSDHQALGSGSIELILDLSQGPNMIAEGDAVVVPAKEESTDASEASSTAVAAIAPSAK